MWSASLSARADLAAMPLNPATALFESALMYLGVTTLRRRPGTGSSLAFIHHDVTGPAGYDVLAAFDNRPAASRFTTALGEHTGAQVRVRIERAGIRHRHDIHHVLIPPPQRSSVLAAMSQAWCSSVALISDPRPPGGTAPRWYRRRAAAESAWRAALLVAAPVRAAVGLRIRVPDHNSVALLVRAGRLLGMDVTVYPRPGTTLVCIERPNDVRTLLAELVSAPADACLTSKTA